MASVLKSLLPEKEKNPPQITETVFEEEATPSASGSDERKKKRKSKPKKAKPPTTKKRNFSIVSLSEVTEGALQIWRTLPEKIRQDPSLASFRQENERIHGE